MSSELTGPDPLDADGADQSAVDADQVAAAALAVDGVHSLHAGLLGEVATYLPGRRLSGVRLKDDGAELHLVLDWGAPVLATTEAVRERVAALVSGRVDLTVEDVAPPGGLGDVDGEVPGEPVSS